MNTIIDTVNSFLPVKRKTSPTGWVCVNAVCCPHNGTSRDTRMRGGINISNDHISWHCFNCGYTASWSEGKRLSVKFKKLLEWLNVPDEQISKCALEALRLSENVDITRFNSRTLLEIPKFTSIEFPNNIIPISTAIQNSDNVEKLIPLLEYIKGRELFLDDYEFYCNLENPNKLIIPIIYNKKIVGYTERNISGTAKVRYIEHAPTGIVFNLDDQYKHTERKYVLVTEGPIDAILVGGTALMGSEINPIQHQLIQRLNREIVVIPDRDHNGLQLINRAVEFGWSVSLPNWEDPLIKDVNDAVKKYGRLYTIYSIFNAIHSTKFKIELMTKIWSKKINARGK